MFMETQNQYKKTMDADRAFDAARADVDVMIEQGRFVDTPPDEGIKTRGLKPPTTSIAAPAGDAAVRVVVKSTFAGKGPVPVKESMDWIYQHLPLADVLPEDAPDAGTWGYFSYLQNDGDAKAKFYESVYPKFCSKDTDPNSAIEDDKREQLAVIDKLIAEAASA